MVKIDIKEFDMSGKPCFLSHACSELFCDETVDFQTAGCPKLLIGSAEINMYSQNSCLT